MHDAFVAHGKSAKRTYIMAKTYIVCIFLLFSVFRGLSYAATFTQNANGTATDNVNNLVWQQGDGGGSKKWEEALTYCETSNLAGLTDWRLPNIKELLTLIDYTQRYDAYKINADVFVIEGSNYWSSTTISQATTSAWTGNFLSGSGSSAKSDNAYVRCVRGGQ